MKTSRVVTVRECAYVCPFFKKYTCMHPHWDEERGDDSRKFITEFNSRKMVPLQCPLAIEDLHETTVYTLGPY